MAADAGVIEADRAARAKSGFEVDIDVPGRGARVAVQRRRVDGIGIDARRFDQRRDVVVGGAGAAVESRQLERFYFGRIRIIAGGEASRDSRRSLLSLAARSGGIRAQPRSPMLWSVRGTVAVVQHVA
jgi:hypothetical protein